MKNILIDVKIHEKKFAELKKISGITVAGVEPSDKSRPLPVELIRDKHILFCSAPPQNVWDMKELELIQIRSTGYSQLYNLGLVERNTKACNARGASDVPIAEWCIAMILNLGRDLRGMIRNQEKGNWDQSAKFQTELRGKKVGFWGYGGIARETARLAKAMGLFVSVLTRHGISTRYDVYIVPGTSDVEGVLPDKVFTEGQERQFLSDLDFLILTMPLTKRTEGIVSEKELRILPDHAYLLNPARGPLVKEESLLKALREGWIAGAALDAHYHYPMPPDHPLWHFPNVIMTPHISGGELIPHFDERIWDIFCQNVKRHLAGQKLLNELTDEQLKGY